MSEVKLPRGLYDSNNQPLLVCPTSEQIKRINRIPRTEYFTTLGDSPEVIKSSDPFETFYLRIQSPLARRLTNDEVIKSIPESHVGIRGSACSLEGELSYKRKTQTLRVRSLEQILADGTDSGEIRIGLAPLNGLDGFPIMYLRFYPWNFRVYAGLFSGQENTDFPIFPLLLVYDKTKLRFDGGSNKYEVPTGEERATSIIRTFVLDYSTNHN